MPAISNLEITLSAETTKALTNLDRAAKGVQAVGAAGDKAASRWEALGVRVGQGLARLTTSLTKFVPLAIGASAALGAVATAGGALSLNSAADQVDKIGKAAARLELNVETVSALRFAAGEANIEFETLSKLVAKGQKELAELVMKGRKDLQVGALTIQLTDANGQLRAFTELLPEIARGLKSAGSAGERLNISTQIFGREGGEQFLQLLAESGNFMQNLAQKTALASRLGVIFTDDQVERLTKYRDSVYRVQQAWLGVKAALANELAPVATALLDGMALRVGQLPQSVRAAGRALEAVRKNEPLGGAGALLTSRVLGAGTEVLKTGALEFGKVGAVAFIESLKVGLTAITPALTRIALDISATVGKKFGIEIEKSPRGQLRDAEWATSEGSVALVRAIELKTRLLEIDKQRNLIAASRSPSTAVDDARLQLEARQIQDNIARLGPAVVEGRRLAEQLQKLRDAVTQQDMVDAKDLLEAIGSGLEATGKQAEQATTRVGDALKTFEEAKHDLLLVFGDGPKAEEPAGAKALAGMLTSAKALRGELAGVAGQLATVAAGAGKDLGERLLKGQGLMFDVAARDADVRGDDDTARRIRMQVQQAREMRDAMEELGTGAEPFLAKLREVQQLEFRALDLGPLEKLRREVEGLTGVDEKTLGRLLGELKEIAELRLSGAIDADEVGRRVADINKKLQGLKTVGQSLGQALSKAIERFGQDASRTFADFVVDGKANLEDLAKSWLKTLVQITAQQAIFEPIAGYIGGALTGKADATKTQGAKALGAVIDGQGVTRFAAGGVVSRPTLFRAANGVGLMGEAGPEAIMPLERIGGKLGVNARQPAVAVQIIDQRGSGAQPEVSERRGPDGRRTITVLIRDEVRKMIGEGQFDRALGASYGLSRRARPA